MIGALYGSLAPLSCVFVALFFLCAHRVFRFLALYVYGNEYEGGGFIFYTLNTVLFYTLWDDPAVTDNVRGDFMFFNNRGASDSPRRWL